MPDPRGIGGFPRRRISLTFALAAVAVAGIAIGAVAVNASGTGTKVMRGGATPKSNSPALHTGDFVAQWQKQPDGSCRNTQGKAGGITAADDPGAGGDIQLKVDAKCRVTVGTMIAYGPANPPPAKAPANGEQRIYPNPTTTAP